MRRRGILAAAPALLAVAAGAWSWQRLDAPGAPLLLGDATRCAQYDGIPPGWPRQRHAGMVRVPGGTAALGSERGYADERPLRSAQLGAFWIDATEVSNAQFAAFIAATGYVTEAERLGAGVVFVAPSAGSAAGPATWWQLRRGADWRHPQGPDSSIDGRAHEPVVQVTRADALAYAQWLGRELPSEAQWEHAARGGLDNAQADAAITDAAGIPQANFWQGEFPYRDDAQDRYAGRAPVGCFAANGYGLFDAIGNVWEWTRDDYHGAPQPHGSGDIAQAVAVPAPATASAVIKGGSYLCAENFCVRYRASARHPQEADLPTSHVGFRTVRR